MKVLARWPMWWTVICNSMAARAGISCTADALNGWMANRPGWAFTPTSPRARAFAERERLQSRKLQTTARLMTMGELASSLAHELNQPLAAIASHAAGCLNRIEQNPGAPRRATGHPLDKIARQARRAGEIIHGIRAFVKNASPSWRDWRSASCWNTR